MRRRSGRSERILTSSGPDSLARALAATQAAVDPCPASRSNRQTFSPSTHCMCVASATQRVDLPVPPLVAQRLMVLIAPPSAVLLPCKPATLLSRYRVIALACYRTGYTLLSC